MATGIAFVGCGYVADLYMPTLQNWSDRIALVGVYDSNSERQSAFTAHHGIKGYDSLDALLADGDVEIVLNLTNPFAHYEVARAALEAGKHVYSEKPLALDFAEARALIDLAREKGLSLCSAPATVLGPAAQALWRAVRSNAAGTPRLVYVELDDGPVHQLGCENWVSPSGARWPAKDEFFTGCTVEHAGYALSWLAAMFGPVRRVVSASGLQIPSKGPETPAPYTTPDFSCAVLEFDGGLRARMTNSIVATHDHRLRIFCDDGVLSVDEIWDFHAPVIRTPIAKTRVARQLEKKLGYTGAQKLEVRKRPGLKTATQGYPIDFAVGPAEMAQAISEGRTPRLNADFALHITEVTLAVQHPEVFGSDYRTTTSFAPMAPMPGED